MVANEVQPTKYVATIWKADTLCPHNGDYKPEWRGLGFSAKMAHGRQRKSLPWLEQLMVKVLMGGKGKVFLGGSNGESPHGRQRESLPWWKQWRKSSWEAKEKVLQKISDRVVWVSLEALWKSSLVDAREKFSRKYQTGWFEFPWKHYGSPPWWRQGESSPENIRPGGLSFPGGIMEVLLGGGKGKVLQKISDRVVWVSACKSASGMRRNWLAGKSSRLICLIATE